MPLVNVAMTPNATGLQELIVELVDKLLTLHHHLKEAAPGDVRSSRLASEVGTVDRELDELVLQLYEAYEYRDVVWG